jgi:hypothetical protein
MMCRRRSNSTRIVTSKAVEGTCNNYGNGSMLPVMGMDLDRVAGPLKALEPVQEKVVRLYFGLGCQRPHAISEIAHEFHVSAQAIADVLREAERQLAKAGLTREELRESARAKGSWPVQRTVRCRHRF